MNILPDLILAFLIIASFIIGCKKGLLKSVWKITALVVTVVLVMLLKAPAVKFVSGTKIAQNINAAVTDKVHLPPGGGVNITESMHLPEFIQPQLDAGIQGTQNTINSLNSAATSSLTVIIVTIATCLALFLIIRLILMAVYMILNGVSKAPVIKGANKLAGGLLAAVNMIFIVFLLLALFTMFAPADSGLYGAIDKSYLVKYFYNYNILLQLFMRA